MSLEQSWRFQLQQDRFIYLTYSTGGFFFILFFGNEQICLTYVWK